MKLKRTIKGTAKWAVRAILAVVVLLSAWLFIAYWRSTNDCERLTAPEGETMKAIVYCDYGSPDVLKLADIAKPVPNDNQALVKVRSASVNPYDWHFMRGEPYIMRLGEGLRKPKSMRLGVDFSGTVEAVGKNITKFKVGDEVFGGKTGAFAEYICVTERGLVPKPDNMTFEQAGAVQIAGITALQGFARCRKASGRSKSLDQRRLRRSRYLRGPDREIARRRGHRRLQHDERRDGPLARRGSRHRLQERRFHREQPALRSDSRHGRESRAVGMPARTEGQRTLRHDWRPSRSLDLTAR